MPDSRVYAIPILAMLLAGCGAPGERFSEPQHRTHSLDLGTFELAHVNLNMGAGELTVDGGSPKFMEGDYRFNFPACEPAIDFHPGTTRADLTIGPKSSEHNINIGNAECHWNLKLNDQKALDLEAHLGVGEAQLNLGRLNLRSVDIKMGVGEVKLDLRGTPSRSYDVHVNGGVGEATVNLPKSVGILATASGGVGDISVHGLERRGSYWINPGHEKDPVTIRVDIKGGVGQITVSAE